MVIPKPIWTCDIFFTLVGLPSLRSPLSSWTGWVFMDWWIDGSVYLIGWFLIGWWTSILWHTLTTDRLKTQPLDSYWWDMSHESWVVSFPICHDFSLLPPSRQIVSYAKRRGPTMPRPNRQPCYTKQLQILCGGLGKWCHWHCDQDVLYLVWIKNYSMGKTGNTLVWPCLTGTAIVLANSAFDPLEQNPALVELNPPSCSLWFVILGDSLPELCGQLLVHTQGQHMQKNQAPNVGWSDTPVESFRNLSVFFSNLPGRRMLWIFCKPLWALYKNSAFPLTHLFICSKTCCRDL